MKQIMGYVLVTGLLALHPAGALAQSFEARVGGFGYLSRRSAAFGGTVGTESGVLGGLAAQIRSRYLGLSAGAWGGSFSADSGAAAGKIANADVSLIAGLPAFSLEAGYARRGFSGAVGTITWSFVRLGARLELPISSSGAYAGLSVAGYAAVKEQNGKGTGSGAEGETSILYLPARLPVYFRIGYGIHRFTARSATGAVPDDVSGIILGIGLRFGGIRAGAASP